MISVAIPFVRIDASQNPNVTVLDGDDPAGPYFRTMTVAFASIRRWNPDAELLFISNAAPPDEQRDHFERLRVQVKIVPFLHRPPEGFSRRFTASLYLLDAVNGLTSTTLIVDPDVLCIDSLDEILIKSDGKVGALKMDFPPEEDINGINRLQAGELHNMLGEPSAAPDHFGGEAYLIPVEHRQELISRSERAWQLTLARHATGLSKFTTEEHILSYALRGVPVFHLNEDIRRIWTTHRYRQVNGDEKSLTLWHLPAEKDRGFLDIYAHVIDPTSWFWTASKDDFADRAGRAMGLHHRPIIRLFMDWAGFCVRAVEDTIKLLPASRTRSSPQTH